MPPTDVIKVDIPGQFIWELVFDHSVNPAAITETHEVVSSTSYSRDKYMKEIADAVRSDKKSNTISGEAGFSFEYISAKINAKHLNSFEATHALKQTHEAKIVDKDKVETKFKRTYIIKPGSLLVLYQRCFLHTSGMTLKEDIYKTTSKPLSDSERIAEDVSVSYILRPKAFLQGIRSICANSYGLSPLTGDYIHEVNGYYPHVGIVSDHDKFEDDHTFLIPVWGPSTDNAPTTFMLEYSIRGPADLPDTDRRTHIGYKAWRRDSLNPFAPPGNHVHLIALRERDNNNFITKVYIHRGTPDSQEYPNSLLLKDDVYLVWERETALSF